MKKEFEALAKENGDRLAIIDIKHLDELNIFFSKYTQTSELNLFQKWLTNEMDERVKAIPRNLKLLLSR